MMEAPELLEISPSGLHIPRTDLWAAHGVLICCFLFFCSSPQPNYHQYLGFEELVQRTLGIQGLLLFVCLFDDGVRV
jgi:hypothetical protein